MGFYYFRVQVSCYYQFYNWGQFLFGFQKQQGQILIKVKTNTIKSDCMGWSHYRRFYTSKNIYTYQKFLFATTDGNIGMFKINLSIKATEVTIIESDVRTFNMNLD
jgi:hypothetical protein